MRSYQFVVRAIACACLLVAVSCVSSESAPDYPGEATRWHLLRMVDENGSIPPFAWQRAIDARRQLTQGANALTTGGIAPSAWVERGPFNVAGRSRTIAIDPRNNNVIWSGGVSGGLWRSTDRGLTWNAVDDWWTNLAIASITLDPGNPDTIWVGTGEGFFNDNVNRGVNRSAIRGAGVFKSTDGGASWVQLPATTSWEYVQRIAVSPANSSVVLAAIRPGGILRSTDGGASWTTVHSAFSSNQVIFDPNDGNRAVAHVVDASLAAHSALWSNDGGASWSAAASGLVGAAVSGYDARIEFAYANSQPGTVFASCGSNGGKVWRSTDNGVNWTLRTGGSATGVTWYFNGFWVAPNDPNVMVAAGLHVWRSTDGGVSFTRITDGYIMTVDPHLDVHTVVADPLYDGVSNRRVYVATDGGLHVAEDILAAGQGTGWRDLDNTQRSTQFYGADGYGPTDTIIGGTQDNGTQRLIANNRNSNMTFGGDGGQVEIDPTNPNYVYGEYVWLQIFRSTNGGSSASFRYNGITEANSSGANFIAPIELDPNSSVRLYGGATRLWRTNNARASTISWTAVKPSVGSKISAIAIADGAADIIWVAHNDGRVYRTQNGLAAVPTWIAVDDNAATDPLPNRYVTRIAIDPDDHTTAWITFGGFTPDNLQVTRNNGATWSSATGAPTSRLPDAPIYCVLVHPDDSDLIYVGTEVGIFASDDGGQSWSANNEGPANVPTEQLVFMHGSRRLLAATLGRGLWTADIRRPDTSVFGGPCFNHASPPTLEVDTATPPRLGGDLTFRGQNLPANATVFWIVGLSDTVFGGGSLPLDLGAVGMPGCQLSVSPDIATGIGSNSGGVADGTLTIPQVPALLGASLYSQMLAPAPGLNALGLGVTNGAGATIGW
ncbi:MAG: WD40/YVTN/BNR-like repeat-containing protein [Planctomycetota bacterium]